MAEQVPPHASQASSDGPHASAQAAPQPGGLNLASRALILLVRLYQVTLGLFMGGHCRFYPTCSEYSIEALRAHGAFRGSWLTIRRIARCHPFGGSGFDPVPPRESEQK